MTLQIAVLKECIKSKKPFRHGLFVHSYEEAQRVMKVYDKLDDRGKSWFEKIDLDVMFYFGNMIGEEVPKSPKQLKQERGKILRAKREAKRAAQICS